MTPRGCPSSPLPCRHALKVDTVCGVYGVKSPYNIVEENLTYESEVSGFGRLRFELQIRAIDAVQAPKGTEVVKRKESESRETNTFHDSAIIP